MNPQARACYDRLLLDSEAEVLFPHGGFGQILVAGELVRDRTTFFAERIVSFRPDSSQRRFRAPLRRVDFLHDHALYRDPRRKIELLLDRNLLPLAWDPTWNQWKHLVRAKIGIEALCIKSGTYRFRAGEWQLVSWFSAVPSRTVLSLPADIDQQIQTARRAFQRLGRFSRELERIRRRLESEPVEKCELDALCAELGIPGDFDVAQISWKPDYDPFYYDQLRKRARKVYLFRAEYILELEHAVVVEVPALGHATYIFAPSPDVGAFVRLYATTTKENLRKNRDGIAERLGFLGRVTHGADPRAWLRELKRRVGESADSAPTFA
jgi:hypothetical protein